MASRMMDVLTEQGKNEIGALNTAWTKHMANGAIADAEIQNYTLVEIFYTEGELHCKPLSDATKKGYLVTTVEEDQLINEGGFTEGYTDFYNGIGEIVRITDVLEQKNSRFETSAFELNALNTKAENGQVAHFDVATGKYIVSKKASAHADYETALNKFEVVDEDSALGFAFDKPTIRLMSI